MTVGGDRAARAGAPLPAARAGSYEAYLRWLRRQDRPSAEAHWRRVLHGFEAPTPLAVERGVPSADRGVRVHARTVSGELSARLVAAAEARHVTLASLFEGAWALLLSRYSGHEDVLFGAVRSGRDGGVPGLEDMFGMFIHTLPARVRVDEEQGVWPWLRAIPGQPGRGAGAPAPVAGRDPALLGRAVRGRAVSQPAGGHQHYVITILTITNWLNLTLNYW